ncbi:MAG: hypothetical protein ABW208_20460, partial [Pyrinomonadaceae bacterium]
LMDIEAGTRVGKYEVQSLVGEGGMGRVYRALDTELRRPVALKFLPSDVASDPRRLERFGREALAASALNHPNIVAVHDSGQTADGRRVCAPASLHCSAQSGSSTRSRQPQICNIPTFCRSSIRVWLTTCCIT